MLQHYFTIALRIFSRSKAYSLINVFGLTLGIACSILIFLFVHDELTYDFHHTKEKEIYRLHGGWRSINDGSSQMYAGVGYNEGEVLKRDFSEVDEVVRFRRFWDQRFEKPGTDDVMMEYMYSAEANIFSVFNIQFVAGNARSALADDHSMVISRKTALKYFNTVDAIGETMRWFGNDTIDFKVTAVIEDHAENTHLKFNLITKLRLPNDLRAEWFEYGYYTYFTLQPQAGIESVSGRIKHFTKKDVQDVEKEIGFIAEHEIIALEDIHLHSSLPGELEPNSKASYVYIFFVVGIFILLMACVNFMNLATARSLIRAREIGIRKVIGAIKGQLIRQFMGEAFMLTLISSMLAVVAASVLLPSFNDFTGKHLSLSSQTFWLLLSGLIVVVTLFAGFYPAFFLSAFRPVQTLKGSFRFSDRGALVRKTLVVFQFTISMSLIAGVLIISSHLSFMRNKDLGFSKEQIMIVNAASPAIKEQVATLAGVENVSLSNRVPGYSVGGRTIIKGWNKTDPQLVLGQLAVDYDFVQLYGLQLLAGRNFDKNIPSDLKEAFLVNESALDDLGFETADQAIGQSLWLEEWGDHKGRIVGVLKDFHFVGVNAAIEPFSMFLHTLNNRFLSIKVSSGNLQEVLGQVESIYKTHLPGRPFQYSFLDQEFDKQYQSEERFMTVFIAFAGLAMVIACLGLYGLATFMTEQRTKEVGIRKVLGASIRHILGILSKDFLKLVAIAFVISAPLAYYGMDQWLMTFPYREDIDIRLFAITGFTVMAATLAVVCYRAFYTATLDPVKTLRSE